MHASLTDSAMLGLVAYTACFDHDSDARASRRKFAIQYQGRMTCYLPGIERRNDSAEVETVEKLDNP